MTNVIIPLARSVLIPLGLTAAASATDAAIQKKIHGSGTTALIIANEEMEDIRKIVESLEESSLLNNMLVKQLNMKQKKKNMDFFQCY